MNSPAGTSPVEHWTFQVDSPFRGPAEIRDLSGRAADEARGAGLGDTWLEAEDPFLTEFEQTDELEGHEEAETEGAEPAEAEAAVAEADLLEETPASEHPLAAVFSLPRLAFKAMAKGSWATAIAVAIGAGLRDVNKLTNMIFWFRHPQMIGQKIRPDQRDLAREWTDIRDGIVKPAFASASAPSAPSSPPTPGPLGAGGRTSIPSDGLRWYGPGEATPELMAFMRKVYDLHVKRSRGDFVDTLPETALEEVESGKKARKDAARKAREILAAARAALAAEGLTGTVRIGVLSAYRSADLQFDIWQGKTTKGKGGFPHYYQETKSTRQHPKYGGEHSDKAAAYLAEYMALYVAAPGYSNHQDGLALDLGTRKGKGGLIKLYKGSWFHNWMCANAKTYQFEPLASEAWHWTYRPTAGASEAETSEFQSSTPFLSAENWASEVTLAAIKAGKLEVQKIPLLASHRGRAPDLILRWNEMPTVPAEIDVVVHLHGYSWATMTLPKHMEVWAGLDLAPVDGASGAGRSRPTLTVLPRGHFTGVKVGKIYRYTFPALTTKDGLTTLVRVAVEHFANQVGGVPPKVGRLIMTAHSGGGAPLMQILRRHDPHEVHVFDGLYQDPSALAEWAGRHITADRAAVQAGGAPSGAMRVFFGPSTRLFSTRLHNAIAADLRAAPTSIADRYRVESSRLGHWQIARQYGWRVLADAGAEVPDAKRPPPTERSVKRLFEVDSAAVPSLPETPFPAEEFDSAEADEAEAWEFGETATEGNEEVDQLGGPEAEGEPWSAPEFEDQEEDEEAPGDLGSLEALGDLAEFGSETESGPGRWGSFARPAAAEDLKGYETSLEAEAVRDFDEAHRSQRDDGLTADTVDEHEEGYWSAEEYEMGAELDDGLTFELGFDEALESLSEERLLFGEAEGEVGAAGESCKKKWFAEVEALPAEVRNAIAYVSTNGTLDLYLLAVRNGIRDERKLLRLMYYSWYGSRYGYCEPQSRPAKAGWNEMAGALKAYKKWPQPPAAQAAPVLCSKQKPVKISPDAPTLDMTGRYYTLHPPSTYVINQAGQHIEGVGSLVLESSSKKSGDHRPVTLFQGDLRGKTYHWFNRDKPSNHGRISERGGHFFISLGLRGNSIVWELMRPIEKRPTVVPAGDLDRSFNELERYELTPLTPVQMKFILAILDKGKLDLIFDTYFNAQKRDTAMDGLWRRLVDTPDHASYVARLEKFHDVDLPLVLLYARQVLTFHKWKSGRNVIRSHIDWIQMMMDRSMGPGGQAAKDFQRYLGMTPNPQRASQDGEHTYEFTIQLTGASLLLAGFFGTVTVEKTSGRRWDKPKTFDVNFWGGNVSLKLFDAKVGSEFKGVGRSYIDWTENDIPGRVRLARASASVGMDLAGAQAGFMHVLGDGSLTPLDVFFWDAKLGVPNVNKILEEAAKTKAENVLKLYEDPSKLTPKGVIGLDAGVMVVWGTISEPGSILDMLTRRSRGPQDIDLSRDLQTDVAVVRSLDTQVHFCLDDDQPTAAAIQALRIVCARELPLFMTPDSILVVVGHADNLGSPEHNKDLSQRRAANTVKAIRNILVGKFKIKDDRDHIRIVGKGEEWAAKESPTKERPAPKHRRVQIYLNSVLVLTLFGQSTIATAPASSRAAP